MPTTVEQVKSILQDNQKSLKGKDVLVLTTCTPQMQAWLTQVCKSWRCVDLNWDAATATHHLHGKSNPVTYMPQKGYLNAIECQSYDAVLTHTLLHTAAVLRTLRFNGFVVSISEDKVLTKQPGFLISSYPRCGTHMLVTALSQHPQLRVYGEVFNPESDNGNHGLKTTSQILEAFWTDPNHGFAAHAYLGHAAGGMKYVTAAYSGFWKHIPRDLRVVSMRRRDLLARYASHMRAKKTKVWNKFNTEAPKKAEPIWINPVSLQEDAAFVKKCWRHVDELYPNRLVVYYEDLCENWETEINRIQEYLGVTAYPVSPTSVKLGKPPSESVSNYKSIINTVKQKGGLDKLKA